MNATGLVRDLLFVPPPRPLCCDCRIRPATRSAGKGGKRGTDFCERCHRLNTDHGDGR